ncbi:MAG: glycosyltransferase family 4 protein, partial [Gammaproteobacteria bacterium]|nr:glycosyltransferase family 4 protein [Gammaproteobacteria bacterium]
AAGVEFHLDLIGEDVLGGAIQRLAGELGLAAQVSFHGFLPQPRVRAQLARADLLLISSRHEAACVAVLEAALSGVPTVGTAVGHIAEWAPQAARAVPVDDPDALAAAIQEVLGDEALRLRLAVAAQAEAMREDADDTARRVEELYAALAPQ